MKKSEKIYIRNGVIAFQSQGKYLLRYKKNSRNTFTRESLVIRFCSNSSIRGLGRISKSETLTLKSIWIIFILSMSVLLTVSSLNLTLEYLDYNTLINSRENHEIINKFPEITFCHHYPFHLETNSSWKLSKVLSPLEFNTMIRKLMQENYKNSNYSLPKLLFTSDTITSYFETIGPEKAQMISHDSSQVLYCLLLLKNSIIKVGHHSECGIIIKTVPNNQFLTCQNIRVIDEYSNNVVALGLIIHMDNLTNILKEFELGLVQDVFRQAHGLRMILHESKSYADLTMDGFNIEPGKFTDVKFSVIKWTKINTPKEPCMLDDFKINLNQTDIHRYTYEDCNNREIGKLIYERCKCYNSKYPLPFGSNINNITYCSKIDVNNPFEVIKRLKCIDEIDLSELIKKVISDSKCVRRCNYMTYECHLTTAHWVPSNWQLHWLMTINDAVKIAESKASDKSHQNNAKDIFQQYINQSKFEIPNNTKKLIKPNRDLFLVINRQSFMTIEKVEVFSLTRSALLSRLGGLSSITLGITFTTIFEIIEFIIMAFQMQMK